MHCVMRHIQEKWLPIAFRLIQCLYRFASERLGGKSSRSPIVAQPGDGIQRVWCSVGVMPIVFIPQLRCQTSCGMAGYIHLKTEMAGILAGRIHCAKVSFDAMYCMLAALPQQIHKRSSHKRALHAFNLAHAVAVPIGHIHHIAFQVLRHIATHGPVGNAMASGV